ACPSFHKLKDACGTCPVCRQIASRSYPYLKFLKPENSEIRVDQVRAITGEIGLMLPADAVQMIIVEPAEKLNPSSSNALLKVLEEPPDRTYFVLIAENELKLLPTIRSRCQRVYIEPPRGRFLEQLSKLKGRSEKEAEALGRLSRASVHLGLSASPQMIADVVPSVLNVLESLIAGSIDPLEAASALVSAASKLRGDGYAEICELIKAIFRDATIFRITGGMEHVGFSDKPDLIERLSSIAAHDMLERCFFAATRAQRAIEGHTNPQLAFEELMINISLYLGLEKGYAE
ncbi:MAG TPA: DNA polymerase III subunit delta', partial [Proteobacteria bacterium]|nr:DNA polymerase III subunit delta' [Pseudomonadota bacterium]